MSDETESTEKVHRQARVYDWEDAGRIVVDAFYTVEKEFARRGRGMDAKSVATLAVALVDEFNRWEGE